MKTNDDSLFYLRLDKDTVSIQIKNNINESREILLNAGYSSVSKTFFGEKIPTEAGTEYAINYIEDELMKNNGLSHTKKTLITSDGILKELFVKNGLFENQYSKHQVENLFNSYAYIILRHSFPMQNLVVSGDNFAALLLLREIMHHLNFETIQFSV